MMKSFWLLAGLMLSHAAFAEPYYCNDFAHTHWQGIILSKNNTPHPLDIVMAEVIQMPAGNFLIDATVTFNEKVFKTTGRCDQNDGHRANRFVFEVPILHVEIGEYAYNPPNGINLLSNLTGQAFMKDNTLQDFYAGQLLYSFR